MTPPETETKPGPKEMSAFRLPPGLKAQTQRVAAENGWTLTDVLTWGMEEFNRLYGKDPK